MSDARDNDVVLALPPSAPRMPRNRFLEGLGRGVLRLGGWRMVGAFPDLPKFVLIAAPHSSNWDGVWGVAVKLAMGVKLSILGKDALVKLPLFGPLGPGGVERVVKRYAKLGNVRRWGVHVFRVTFATLLYDDGVDIERIRILMGHESIETTRRYISVSQRNRKDRLKPHRQHAALGTAPDGMPAWAKQLESQA